MQYHFVHHYALQFEGIFEDIGQCCSVENVVRQMQFQNLQTFSRNSSISLAHYLNANANHKGKARFYMIIWNQGTLYVSKQVISKS